jgi:hypothetical protein
VPKRECQVIDWHINRLKKDIEEIGMAAEGEPYDPEESDFLPYYSPESFERVRNFLIDHFAKQSRYHGLDDPDRPYYPTANFGVTHDGAGGFEVSVRDGWHHCKFYFESDSRITAHLYTSPWLFDHYLNAEECIDFIKDYMGTEYDAIKSKWPNQSMDYKTHNFARLTRDYARGKITYAEFEEGRTNYLDHFAAALDQYVQDTCDTIGEASHWIGE